MKLATFALLAFSTVSFAGGMPQDQPKPKPVPIKCDPVIVKEPCPACPSCPPCAPCDECDCSEYIDLIEQIENDHHRIKPGTWLIGGGLSWYDPGKTDLSWLHSRVDPHAEIDHDSQFGLTAAGGYRFPSGIQILGAVTRYEGGSGSVTWKEYVRNAEATDTRVSSGDSWSVSAIVLFEVGRK